MIGFRLPRAIAVVGLSAVAIGQIKESALPNDYPYSPAFISTISAPQGHTELMVFPINGKAFKIPLRSASVPQIFAPDGTALYGSCTPFRDQERPGEATKIALCKLDLKTGDTSTVPGTAQDFVRGRAPTSGVRAGLEFSQTGS